MNQDLILEKMTEIIFKQPGLDLLMETEDGYLHQDLLYEIENEAMSICGNQINQEIQTETHLYDKYIDPNHQWNEWELRKQTIKMVNI